MREKKGNRRRTTLSLLNADAKALCLRPDPELVKVFGIPPRRRSVESCPSASSDEAPVARHRAHGDLMGSREKHTRRVSRTTRQRARAGHVKEAA